jgi:hypothetical protein
MLLVNTKLKGKKLDPSQLGKALVDQAAKIGKKPAKKPKAKQ